MTKAAAHFLLHEGGKTEQTLHREPSAPARRRSAVAKRTGNRILDLLPGEESSLLLSSSQAVSLLHGKVVYQDAGPMPHVYFPTTSVFGIVLAVEDGKQVEGTTVGKEGMMGLPAFLGIDFHPLRGIVQAAGEALQISTGLFRQAAKPGSALDRLLRRYTLYRLRCANQMGACNMLHSVEERLTRWLLMAHDGAGQEEFLLTHEFLGELLGVRRQTISIVAGTLQRAGLITYRRGILRVLDREGLEASSCECYTALKHLYDRIMKG
jgi:CRP-like cAMP-binding protein